eukprot:1158517-Pelagomonas_calceolata.AAC.12
MMQQKYTGHAWGEANKVSKVKPCRGVAGAAAQGASRATTSYNNSSIGLTSTCSLLLAVSQQT